MLVFVRKAEAEKKQKKKCLRFGNESESNFATNNSQHGEPDPGHTIRASFNPFLSFRVKKKR